MSVVRSQRSITSLLMAALFEAGTALAFELEELEQSGLQASAMGRNKVIYALSKATLVVASDEDSGGTWSGATEALKRGIAPVITWVGEGSGPGNEPLQRPLR